ncbi:MAG: helix-turn-helix domain-containing protein [Actinomycetota bacterium]|nr:helix-turn-helix domain-containing protein [Actinomycetota bacterium]
MTVLLREAIGDRLRLTRTSQCRTLREVSREARVSLGYLSEVERGRKEASSELLASICGALALPLDELLRRVAGDVGPGFGSPVPDTVPDELVDSAGEVDGGRIVVPAGERLTDLRVAPVSTSGPARPRAMAGVAA